jgi:hypothetical protein
VNKKKFIGINCRRKDGHWSANKRKMMLNISSTRKTSIITARLKIHVYKEILESSGNSGCTMYIFVCVLYKKYDKITEKVNIHKCIIHLRGPG